mgnify:CR=1 FL=1
MVVLATETLQDSNSRDAILQRLDRSIQRVVLDRQDPISGLLPASTAHTIHGDYGDAWVRDCVYSIHCVWGLVQAHRRRHGATSCRAWELEQRVLALMRGLLRSMLRQAAKVERFKRSLDPLDALHAKYDSCLGTPVVPDDGWGHLQLDATSLFLLQLAQLTRSGLPVVRNSHETDFIQNLIHYIARTYRTPDYGIWERGDKGNHGLPERNASSIGMAKAALEALDGFDLYGPHGDGSERLLIPQGALVRMRRALQNLLPRESASKEADSACLSIVGYPAWSVDDAQLRQRTTRRIRRELAGNYGYKRFLREGHQSAIEDSSRLHYEPEELAEFEHIESEWPLFMAYELVTACFEERWDDAKDWLRQLKPLAIERDGQALYPELYWIPSDRVDAERACPGSQQRVANDNLPLLWTQSLIWLGDMLLEGLIRPDDLDPCQRRKGQNVGTQAVLIAVAPGSDVVQAELLQAGVPLDGNGQVAILNSLELEDKLRHIGINSRLDGLQAAILRVKLKHLRGYLAARQAAAARYDSLLEGCAGLHIPVREHRSSHVFHQYTLKIEGGRRDALRAHLAEQGIPSGVYYPVPGHTQQAFSQFQYNPDAYPVSVELAQTVLSLPMHTELTEEQQQFISDVIIKFID